MLHRRHLCGGEKGGLCVGKTKRGKGTKIMAITDGSSLPLAIHIESASPHEVTLVTDTLQASHVRGTPDRLVGDKAYDSDPLDAELMQMGIDVIAPHRRNRGKLTEQDSSAALSRITTTTELSDLADSDLVVEAIFENFEVKSAAFKELDRLLRPEAILSSNTSSIDITRLAAVTSRPDRVIGMH